MCCAFAYLYEEGQCVFPHCLDGKGSAYFLIKKEEDK